MMSAFDIYCELEGRIDGKIACDERMSRHVTYGIGGPAALFIECASIADLTSSVDLLNAEHMPWAPIGRGSNLLVSDEGCSSAIITLGQEFRKMTVADDHLIVAGAGIALSTVTQEAFKHGYAGFEFAVGIPGTLGGALYMNAGSRTEWIGNLVESLTVFTARDGLQKWKGSDISWGYRSSGIPRSAIILEAELRMTPGDIVQIRNRMEANLDRRKQTQPLSYPSAGSVFKNPEGNSAGRLIESVGLKGTRHGDAQISEKHANFIINTGNATAADVLSLIVLAKNRVKEAHGIELQPEIQFLGF